VCSTTPDGREFRSDIARVTGGFARLSSSCLTIIRGFWVHAKLAKNKKRGKKKEGKENDYQYKGSVQSFL
jgi:hypothetical protein